MSVLKHRCSAMDDRQTDAFWSFAGDGSCSSPIDSFAFGINNADVDRIASLKEAAKSGAHQNGEKHDPSESSLCAWITWLDCAERGYKRLYGAPVRIPYASLSSTFSRTGASLPNNEAAPCDNTAGGCSTSRWMRLPLDLQSKVKTPIFPLPMEYIQSDAPPAYLSSRPTSGLTLSLAPPTFEPASPDVFYFNNGGCLLVHPNDLHPYSMELHRKAESAWSGALEAGEDGSRADPGSLKADSESKQAQGSSKTVSGHQPSTGTSATEQESGAHKLNGQDSGERTAEVKDSNASGSAEEDGTNAVASGQGGDAAQQTRHAQKQSLEEELLNERQRRRCLGVSRYVWSEQGKKILLANSSGLWIYDRCSAIESLTHGEDANLTSKKPASKDCESLAFDQAAFLVTNPLTRTAYSAPPTGKSGSQDGSAAAASQSGLASSADLTSGEECDTVKGFAGAAAQLRHAKDKALHAGNPDKNVRGEVASAESAKRLVSIHPSGRSRAFGSARLLVPRKKEGGRSILDFSFSPDGSRVAFVHDQDIHVAAFPSTEKPTHPEGRTGSSGGASTAQGATHEETAAPEKPLNGGICMLTTSGKNGSLVNGLAEYVAQEEMSRSRGYWWSPCGDFIAFCQYEENHIKPLCLQRVQLPQYQTADTASGAGAAASSASAKRDGTTSAEADPSKEGQKAEARLSVPGASGGEPQAAQAVDREIEEEWTEEDEQEGEVGDCEMLKAARDKLNGHVSSGNDSKKAAEGHASQGGKSPDKGQGEPEELLIQEEHHFPFAGLPNVRIRVGVLQVPSASELRRAAACRASSGEVTCLEQQGAAEGKSSSSSASACSLPGYSLYEPLQACPRCRTSCVCRSAPSTPAGPSSAPGRAAGAAPGSPQRVEVSSSAPLLSRERFLELPVHDWKEDFYVARAQWIALEDWSDLVVLKLLTREEAELMKEGLRRPAQAREEASGLSMQRENAAAAETGDAPSPPPVLLLQLQDRLQQELRICAALPWLPSDFGESPAEHREEKLRCVVCFTERSRFWINLHDDLHQVGKSLWYLWSAERKTMNELYLQNLALPELSFRLSACAPHLRLLSVLAPPTLPLFSSSGHRYVIFSANRQTEEAPPSSTFVCLAQLPKESDLKSLQRWCLLEGQRDSAPTEEREKLRGEEKEEKAGWKRGTFWGQRGKWRIEIRDLHQPWAFVTNPAVEGVHSFAIADKLPLIAHQHHSRVSPRQIWIRYIPDWDEVLRREHVSPAKASLFYSLSAAAQRGQAVFERQLRLEGEVRKDVQAAQEKTQNAQEEDLQCSQAVEEEGGVTQSTLLQGQEIDLQVLRGCEHLLYAYGDTAAAGMVLHEFQQVQRLYVRVVRSLVAPVPFQLENEGERLYGCYYRPSPAVHGPGPYRAVVSLYGGPTLQFVPDAFDLLMDMRAQALAKLGLIVVKVDSRGSFGRSVAFEKAAIHRRLGSVELRDQRAAVEHLRRLGLVALHAHEAAYSPRALALGAAGEPLAPNAEKENMKKRVRLESGKGKAAAAETPRRSQRKRSKTGAAGEETRTPQAAEETPARGEQGDQEPVEDAELAGNAGALGGDGLVTSGVGIYGISYGGYLAAMAHFTHPEFFTCCWSAAPVTAWELYSTHYTERFLSLPHLNAEGYKQSSVLSHVKFLEPQTNRLKLLHGYLDENVHMQHSLLLIDKMIQHQLPADFVCLPQSRHGPNIPSERRFFTHKLFLFFAEHLLPPQLRPKWPSRQPRSPAVPASKLSPGSSGVPDPSSN
ncbi:hypothetical protein BESB_006960 [Besnoitia besnoiti]|uniref:Dipeptidyl peptidase iv (Dpp iv) n-terminal region domain-containing protein n=1 Tax=Besnoitia besnoiti TaxID=94643 RepID=A0A2A9MK57_BESBE|nr:hypothetical protein BESB_006960 [Besnoitia besnoiti]PFH38355.1 hypothetical protein BESB_006960 [Besnoitia besnoiti]